MINQEIHKLLNEEYLKDNEFKYGIVDGKNIENSSIWMQYRENFYSAKLNNLSKESIIDKIKQITNG